MKYWNQVRTFLCVALSVGIWSFLYPELLSGSGICSVVEEREVTKKECAEDLLSKLFETNRQNVRLRLWFLDHLGRR